VPGVVRMQAISRPIGTSGCHITLSDHKQVSLSAVWL
jgi:hypothetical protein